MGEPLAPKPVLLFCGVIFAPGADLDSVAAGLESEFGPIAARSGVFPFDCSDYYQEEMGGGLGKAFFSFERLIPPDEITAVKLKTNALENEIARASGSGISRPVNLDPGYVGLAKMVLATTKDNYHRIYLRDGIYAEVTLSFVKGSFRPFDWTYPDYRKPEYIDYFNMLRTRYREMLRAENQDSLFNARPPAASP